MRLKIAWIFFVLIVALLLSACAPAVMPADELSDPVAATSATKSALVAAESAAETVQEPSLEEALLAVFPNSPQAEGEVVFVTGKVMDTNGMSIANAAVEFWQTDANGVYDHPGDATTAQRDQAFQFFGTSVTDVEGRYYFRTIVPGYYEPRPKHIHLKVKLDGATALVSQFYFEEERSDLNDEELILTVVGSAETERGSVRILANDLVIDSGGGAGSLPLTPAQGEGPFYPLVNVADYDNDLAVVQ